MLQERSGFADVEDPHNSSPHQSRSESQLYADDSTPTQQAAEVNVTMQVSSSTDQAPPPHLDEFFLAPPTTSPDVFALHANVVVNPSIREDTEAISPDLNLLVSMATHSTHPSPRPSLSTTDVVPAEEDISPQIARAFDANVAIALSTRGNRHGMVHSVLTEVSCHESEPVPLNSNINEDAPAPGGQLGV